MYDSPRVRLRAMRSRTNVGAVSLLDPLIEPVLPEGIFLARIISCLGGFLPQRADREEVAQCGVGQRPVLFVPRVGVLGEVADVGEAVPGASWSHAARASSDRSSGAVTSFSGGIGSAWLIRSGRSPCSTLSAVGFGFAPRAPIGFPSSL